MPPDDRSPVDESVDREPSVGAERRDESPSLLVRALWFVFVGSWLSGLWLSVAWVLNVTVIGMPLGLKMINKVPYIVSLKARSIENQVIDADGEVTVRSGRREQRSLLVRGVYFVLVGWWASAFWMAGAWLLSVSIVGLPVAVWMYGKLPLVVSLYRY